jgi:hypothetical protein
VPVFEAHPEHGVRKGFRHRALEFDHVVFCHVVPEYGVVMPAGKAGNEAMHFAMPVASTQKIG